ncbi:MAG: hypothetical protein K8T26_01020 [Lentisphaerae bacterium]|nr:hypothetical protein [Lentisphaerota bacterium]
MSDRTSILGHPITFDSAGHVLSWHQPEVPGAGYDHVVRLAAEFFLKRCPVDPRTGLPLYLVTSSFSKPDLKALTYTGDVWPSTPACVHAGAVESFAVGYYGYTGDPACLGVVGKMLDHQMAHGTTPTNFAWPGVPYASADPFAATYEGGMMFEHDGSRGDGLHGIEPDKVGELGYGYVRFYEITQNTNYLQAALQCADVLAAHAREVKLEKSTLRFSTADQSPWPFRVNARTGVVISDYTSNVLAPVMLFDELIRIADRVALQAERKAAYQAARDLAWAWLYSRNGPMKTFVWNGYFEDIPNDPSCANRVQTTPGELAKYLIRHPGLDPNVDANVATLIRWIATVFKADGWDAIKEQLWCYEPMGSHTARYGAACALFFERTGDPYYKEQATRFLNYATYMTLEDGFVAVGPNWPGAWWSDGYTDYVRHFIDAMGAVPEWAPASENHLLRSSSVVQQIRYAADSITLTTFDANADLVFRLTAQPARVLVDGQALTVGARPAPGQASWTPLPAGGVLRILGAPGKTVAIAWNPT